jgi:hypothetical protein
LCCCCGFIFILMYSDYTFCGFTTFLSRSYVIWICLLLIWFSISRIILLQFWENRCANGSIDRPHNEDVASSENKPWHRPSAINIRNNRSINQSISLSMNQSSKQANKQLISQSINHLFSRIIRGNTGKMRHNGSTVLEWNPFKDLSQDYRPSTTSIRLLKWMRALIIIACMQPPIHQSQSVQRIFSWSSLRLAAVHSRVEQAGHETSTWDSGQVNDAG